MNLKKTIIAFLCILSVYTSYSQEEETSVLVFSKTARNRHKSIPAGIDALTKLGIKNNWTVDFSEEGSMISEKNLSKYDVIVFLNTTGEILSEGQRKALKGFFAKGKGFVGIHSASDTENKWPWYTKMIGATFKSHPKVQEAAHIINIDSKHPAIEGFNSVEKFTDEWYNFREPVAKRVNVLATLDESSYEGKKMDMEHPITWYHIYDGAKVFYTGLGHSIHTFKDKRFLNQIEGGISWAAGLKSIRNTSKKWTNLLEVDPSKNWDVFIGAPRATVKGLKNVDTKSDGKNSKPLGLNNDPKNVFSFEKDNGENVLHISGEIYGALTSKQEYENYHLKLQFKWGEQIWEPRLKRKRDSGILYHCYGPYDSFWNVWMSSQEFQVQEGDLGDYYGLSGTLIDIPSEKKAGEKEFNYLKNGDLNPFSSLQRLPPNHANKGFDNENPHGEWNTLELISFKGTSYHIVNGKVVMALYNSRYKNAEGIIVPLTKGRIQIQSEAAEVFYKNIQIKSIKKLPRKFKKQLK